jgi:hypothetical protein
MLPFNVQHVSALNIFRRIIKDFVSMRPYRRFTLVALLLVMALLMALNATALLAAGQGTVGHKDATTPQAVFPDTRYDFEPVMEGTRITHDFIIENHGDAPLIIKSVRPD